MKPLSGPLMRLSPWSAFAALLMSALAGCAVTADGASAEVPTELAPTGRLRVGLVYAPEPSPVFVIRDAAGQPRGATLELARDLERRAGRPLDIVLAPNTGVLTDGLAGGTLDVAFMPVDEERRRRVDFGPTYFVAENTYLARAGSGIATQADVDRPGVRVIGVANTTTIRSATALLKHATVAPVESVERSLEMIRDGQADAFALTRDTLATLAPRVPGARIIAGSFRRLDVAVAVPKDRPRALAFVSDWLQRAKASGVVRRAFDSAGLTTAEVAP